jgi:3-deoxy-D-arabino-heptulosonate 7-phosphate (DAHP) synthase
MLDETAQSVRRQGARLLRGGAFKPRTSPHAFQGLGQEALEMLAEARQRTQLPVVTEVMDVRQVEMVARYADVLQIGARNMYNTPLLSAVEPGCRFSEAVLLRDAARVAGCRGVHRHPRQHGHHVL